MRAFVGQFDRVSLGIVGLGVALGLIWLVAVDLGVALAGLVLGVAAVALIIHHRWIEIAMLMIAVGVTVQVGYAILGVPNIPPATDDFVVPTEAYAPGIATLLWAGGLLLGAVIAAWDLWEARRRQRLDARHRRRRTGTIAGS
ncbi:MAG: hypothetical protein ABIW50_08325 [Candidatus Limnocylindria bacterium]